MKKLNDLLNILIYFNESTFICTALGLGVSKNFVCEEKPTRASKQARCDSDLEPFPPPLLREETQCRSRR